MTDYVAIMVYCVIVLVLLKDLGMLCLFLYYSQDPHPFTPTLCYYDPIQETTLGLALGLAPVLALGLVNVLALGLVKVLALGLALGLVKGLTLGLALGLALGLTLGLLKGLALGLALGLLKGLTLGLALGLVKGLEFGLVKGLTSGLMGLALILSLGLTLGLAFVLTFVLKPLSSPPLLCICFSYHCIVKERTAENVFCSAEFFIRDVYCIDSDRLQQIKFTFTEYTVSNTVYIQSFHF